LFCLYEGGQKAKEKIEWFIGGKIRLCGNGSSGGVWMNRGQQKDVDHRSPTLSKQFILIY
jgi:hypothetical protein